MRGIVREDAFDPARIMASIGEAPYEWTIESDVLAWGANATDVLMVGHVAAISSGATTRWAATTATFCPPRKPHQAPA